MQTELEILLAKRQLLDDLLKKRDAIKADGLAYYKPHAKQDAFHRAGEFKWRLWEAGNRSGKSTGGVAEDASFLRGYRPFYPVGDPARTAGIPQGRPLIGLVVANDWKKVGEIFTGQRGEQGKLWKFLPPDFIKSTRTNSEGVIDLVECQNGSILNFTTVRAFMSNPMSVESVDNDFVHFDEPLPKDMFVGIKRGLIDRRGKGWFTLTPKTEPWIHYMFFPSRRMKDALVIEGRKWAQRGSMNDNPYLPPEEIVDFKEGLSKDQLACLIDGIPMAMSGLVYKEFDHAKHVLQTPLRGWKGFANPPDNATIYVAIDPHPQTPHHVMFLAVLPYDVPIIYDEIFLHCPIPELAKRINDKVAGKFAIRFICDPAAWLEHPNTHVNSYAQDFAEAGLFLSKASKDRSAGILQGQRRLATPDGIYLSPLLEETIFEFETHCWDTKENKPVDKDDHAMENYGRLCLEKPIYIDQSKPSTAIDVQTFEKADLGEFQSIDSELD